MIWLDRSTYFFKVIVVPPIGSKLLTDKVSTEPASRRLLRTLQVGDMQKKKGIMKCIVLSNQYDHYLGKKWSYPWI